MSALAEGTLAGRAVAEGVERMVIKQESGERVDREHPGAKTAVWVETELSRMEMAGPVAWAVQAGEHFPVVAGLASQAVMGVVPCQPMAALATTVEMRAFQPGSTLAPAAVAEAVVAVEILTDRMREEEVVVVAHQVDGAVRLSSFKRHAFYG